MNAINLGLKDVIYLLTYLISVVSVFLAFKAKLNSLEKDLIYLQRILLGDRGALNVVDQKTCSRNRDHIYESVRRTEHASDKIFVKLEEMDKNILALKEKGDSS